MLCKQVSCETKREIIMRKVRTKHFVAWMIHLAIICHVQGSNDNAIPPTKIMEPDLRYKINLDSSNQVKLMWDIDPVSETVNFRVNANTKKWQWAGFGFSDYGESTNADLVVFWTDPWGKHHFQDAYTDEEGLLHIDPQQDYTLDAGRITTSGISLSFHRLYDTCDTDDYIIDAGTTHLIFFTAPGPVMSVRGANVTSYKPLLQRVQLLKSQLPDPKFPDDTFTFTMHVDNVKIPAQETTYWCQVKHLPVMEQKHHIIRFEGAISAESQGIVHHLEVFHCEVPRGQHLKEFNGPSRTMGAERPAGLEACRKVIGAWAMGALPLTYPIEAGYPIGGKDFSTYIMMEVHYNNPEKVAGIVDNSGIKFYVTPTLRKYDAGTMELGLEYTDKMALPPGQDLFNLVGYCIPQCTQVGLGSKGIKIFASQLHTHQTGKKVYTKHYRNGIELRELNRDDHYSPHYQEIRKLPKHVHVMPGDMLTTTCEDTTKNKEEITLGGFSISDEMCVNYVHYYPRVELEVCKSSITTSALYRFFSFMNQYLGQGTSPEMGISDNYKAIDWTPMNVRMLNTLYESAPLSMQCNQSDGNRFPGHWEDLEIPEIKFPMPPTSRPCLQ